MVFFIAVFLVILVIAAVAIGGAGWLVVLFIRGSSRSIPSNRGRLWLALLLLTAGVLIYLFYKSGMGVFEQFPMLAVFLLVLVTAVLVGGLRNGGQARRRRQEIQALVTALGNPSAEIRSGAAAQLCVAGAEVVEELTRAASDRGFPGRPGAVYLLGETADPLSAEDRLFLFHRQTDDTEPPEVREAAASALAALLGRAARMSRRETLAFRIGATIAAARRRISPRRHRQTGAAPELAGGPATPRQLHPGSVRDPVMAQRHRANPPLPPPALPAIARAARVAADAVSEAPDVGGVTAPSYGPRLGPPPAPIAVRADAAKPVTAASIPPAVPSDAGRYRVFVSHSSLDSGVGHLIGSTLERNQISCWIAPRDIPPGAAWGEAIIDGINGSRVMVVVLSRNSMDSPQVLREVERAVAKRIAVIAFRIEDVPLTPGLEYFLSAAQWLNAVVPPMEMHLVRLEAAVNAAHAATTAHSSTS